MQKWTHISKYAGECSCNLGLGKIQDVEDQPIKTNHVNSSTYIVVEVYSLPVYEVISTVHLVNIKGFGFGPLSFEANFWSVVMKIILPHSSSSPLMYTQ